MRTFDASITARWFWGAVFVPPLVFFTLVQYWGGAAESVDAAFWRMLLLAQALPLAALAWTLCSVAAYSIGHGKLVVHRVVGDREFSLQRLSGPPRIANGVVTVPIAGHALRLRVAQPESCLAALVKSAPSATA